MKNKRKELNDDFNLPTTWFEARMSREQIKSSFSKGKKEIRIASGFFTVKGWSLIRSSTKGKKVYILVGIEEPGEERAKAALVNEIMRDLRTGLDRDRRKSVLDLVERMESGVFNIVDARATSHHAKLYIVDKDLAIVTSANTTGRGLIEQIESGARHEKKEDVIDLVEKFDKYFADATDITQQLLEKLKAWLELCDPWDIYLKTLLALEQIKPVKTTYSKKPVIYQQDMISLTLSQIREYGGSMLVASTGLGKTVMGTLIAVQLKAEDFIDKVIIICPNAVKKAWHKEMRDASISANCITLETLDKEDSTKASDLDNWDNFVEDIKEGKGRYLLILDESHRLRKRYPDHFANKYSKSENRRERKAFTRINQVVNKIGDLTKVKVLLLTGSPYATNIDNINVQLHLLPHKAKSSVLLPEYFDDPHAWKIRESKEFINLEVAHQLTTPHVAKYYGELDEIGRYINFGDQKKYFPDVDLYTIDFPLVFKSDLTSAITQGYFDLNITNPMYQKNIVTQIKKDWASSPLALQESLEKVIDTPDGPKAFNLDKSDFVISKEDRQKFLQPIINKLKVLKSESDEKLQILIKIIDFHCLQGKQKLVIFCERYPTAFYLEKEIKMLKPSLKIFSTIEQKNINDQHIEYQSKTLKKVEEAIEKFAPIANNKTTHNQESYDLFITTDNYGIGVNMQDASVVVNYDIAWTPIEPIQRAGRILRFWDDFRTVRIYTFVPMPQEETELQYDEIVNIGKRWEKLMERHKESQKLTDLPVLTSDNNQLINMPDFAPDTVKRGRLNLEQADDQDVSRYYQHIKKLHSYRQQAENLDSDLVSALNYPGKDSLLYVLLKYQDEYKILLYEQEKDRLRSPNYEYILDLIECNPETEIALVDTEIIEELADIAIKEWCNENEVPEEDVSRECTLYLIPENQENQDNLKQMMLSS